MKIKYIYTKDVTEALTLIDDAMCSRKAMLRNELEQELTLEDDMFNKYFREYCVNDYIIKQLRDKKNHIMNVAIPISITLE